MSDEQNNNSQNKKVPDITNPEVVNEIWHQGSRNLAETLTGTAGLFFGKKGLIAGRVVQGWMNNNLIEQLGSEIRSLQRDGKIQENYLERDIDRSNFSELLKFIDQETPDEYRFKAMKSIFLSSVEYNNDEAQKYLAYELTQICKRLSSGEILLLKAIYEIKNGNFSANVNSERFTEKQSYISTETWLVEHAKQIGHEDPSLVQLHENNLVKNELISDRIYPDRSGVNPQNNRLTSLGENLCKFITRYDKDYEPE